MLDSHAVLCDQAGGTQMFKSHGIDISDALYAYYDLALNVHLGE